jgi:predicted esterase
MARLVLAAVVASALACDGTQTPPGPAGATVVLDRADPDFYARPFPRADRTNPDGTIDLSGYPPTSALVRSYLAAMAADRHGFGENAAIYFRFSAPIDESSLPADAAASMAANASVYAIDLGHGGRVPVQMRFRASAGRFAGPNLLAIAPFPGIPLSPQTAYAAVVTTRVRDLAGAAVSRDVGFDAALAGPLYQPLRNLVASGGGDSLADIAGATVFQTGDPTSDLRALHDAVARDLPAPPQPTVMTHAPGSGFDEYDGVYVGPNYQQGTPPYLTPAQGGTIQFDDAGRPQLVRTEPIRFALTVPSGAAPAAGWPVVLYAHGTGGSYHSFIDEGVAAELAAQGVAAISIDQVLHGPRDPTGSDPNFTFFNFQNIAAARDNVRQGATDDFQLLRLVQSWPANMALPGTMARVRLDPNRLAFMGHSQGGLTGPPFVAYAREIRGAVFSGAAGLLVIGLLHKTEPVDIPGVVSTLLEDDPIDEFHPFLNLLQGYFEAADPVNYGRLFFREPVAGVPARSIFQTVGIIDHYAPVPGLKAFLLAIGLTPVGALPQPIDGLSFRGLTPIAAAPVSGNVANGAATGVAVEYVAAPGDDGHFVAFDNADARRQLTGFLVSAVSVASGPAILPP